MLSGPDTGIIKATVDGKLSKEIETLRKYSSFNYPMTVMFFNELENGEHTLELEILPNPIGGKGRPGGGKLGGTALRAIGFTAN